MLTFIFSAMFTLQMKKKSFRLTPVSQRQYVQVRTYTGTDTTTHHTSCEHLRRQNRTVRAFSGLTRAIMCNMLSNLVALSLPVSCFTLNLSPSLSLHATVTVASVDVLLATGGSICPKRPTRLPLWCHLPAIPLMFHGWSDRRSET